MKKIFIICCIVLLAGVGCAKKNEPTVREEILKKFEHEVQLEKYTEELKPKTPEEIIEQFNREKNDVLQAITVLNVYQKGDSALAPECQSADDGTHQVYGFGQYQIVLLRDVFGEYKKDIPKYEESLEEVTSNMKQFITKCVDLGFNLPVY